MARAAFFFLVGLLGMPAPLAAHPHVWIEADATLILGPDGRLTALDIAWTFDELYSEDTVIDAPGRTPADLRPLLADTLPNLAPWLYFTDLRADDTRAEFGPVDTYEARWRDGRLTYAFTLPLETPVDLDDRTVVLRMYDPSFFVDIAVPEDKVIGIKPDGSGCAITRHPAPEEPDVYVLSDSFQIVPIEPGGEGIGFAYAELWKVTCP